MDENGRAKTSLSAVNKPDMLVHHCKTLQLFECLSFFIVRALLLYPQFYNRTWAARPPRGCNTGKANLCV